MLSLRSGGAAVVGGALVLAASSLGVPAQATSVVAAGHRSFCSPGIDTAACRDMAGARTSGVRLRREAQPLTFLPSQRDGVDVAFDDTAREDGDILGTLFPDASRDRTSFTGRLASAANRTIDLAVATAPSVTGTIAAVPEPAGWATMILGVGLLGGVLRRRIRQSEARFAEKLRRIEAGEPL